MSIDYQEHLNSLSEQLGCKLIQAPKLTGMMYVEFGYVEGPELGSYGDLQTDYLICLHELGHFVHGHTQGRPPKQKERVYFENGVLKSEAQAWDWALNISKEENIKYTTRKFMWNVCLGSYYNAGRWAEDRENNILHNGNRHYVKFKYDKPDDYFWSVVKLIKGMYYNERNPGASMI